MTPAGLSLVKHFEGCRLKAYQDIGGVWTIGYGHTEGVKEGMRITTARALDLLDEDLAKFEMNVQWLLTVPAMPYQADAMTSLAFNIGAAAFKRSSVLRWHNARYLNRARLAFAAWNKAGGKVVGGLTRRRAAEARLYAGEAWREA